MTSMTLSAALAGSFLLGSVAFAGPKIVAHDHGPERLRVVVEGSGYRLETSAFARQIEVPGRAGIESVSALGRSWLIAGTAPSASGPELLFLKGDERSETRLPVPPGRVGAIRQNPVPFARGDELLGAAWLEGPEARKFEVRFAPWSGDRFAAPEIVAPAGAGSQLALQGSRLADGRLLLIWSGYDGQDDEIWFSVRVAEGNTGSWSAPARVADDNATPDIVPAVATLGAGALVAWSRFDGSEYRLMTARFDGERMRDSRYAAPPGTLYPTIEQGPKGPALLFRDAGRSRWTIAEIGADGALGRSTSVDGESDARPLVSFEGGSVLWSVDDRSAVSAWQ